MIFIESPIYDYSTLVNSIGIFLEIAGLFFTIGVVRRIVRGDFVSDDFVREDFATNGHSETKVVPNPNPRLFFTGISLVIAGLFGQFVAQGIRGGW
jgi:hypothetical protein